MITGLPPLVAPIEQSVRCVCGLRYVVFIGGSAFDDRARDAAIERAEQMKALFIDARQIPFMVCSCGLALDFSTVEAGEMVM